MCILLKVTYHIKLALPRNSCTGVSLAVNRFPRKNIKKFILCLFYVLYLSEKNVLKDEVLEIKQLGCHKGQ